MAAKGDEDSFLYCDLDGHRLARWRGRVIDPLYISRPLGLEDVRSDQEHIAVVCHLHLTQIDKESAVYIGPEAEIAEKKVACQGEGTYSDAPSIKEEPVTSSGTTWMMRYGVDVPCTVCGRVFSKLVANKEGRCHVPQHGRD